MTPVAFVACEEGEEATAQEARLKRLVSLLPQLPQERQRPSPLTDEEARAVSALLVVEPYRIASRSRVSLSTSTS